MNNYDPVTMEPLSEEDNAAAESLKRQPSWASIATGSVPPMGPYQSPMSPPSTGNPDLDAQLARQASGFGDRNVPNYSAGESLGYLGQVGATLGELGTSSYSEALGLGSNPVLQEFTRPVNYAFGGANIIPAVTGSLGARAAEHVSEPYIEQLPEGLQGPARIATTLGGALIGGGLGVAGQRAAKRGAVALNAMGDEQALRDAARFGEFGRGKYEDVIPRATYVEPGGRYTPSASGGAGEMQARMDAYADELSDIIRNGRRAPADLDRKNKLELLLGLREPRPGEGVRGPSAGVAELGKPWPAASNDVPASSVTLKNGRNVVVESYGDGVGRDGYNGGFLMRDAETGQRMGYIEYQSAASAPDVTIAMVRTEPQFQRQGVADTLLERLRTDFPDKGINPGMVTPNGDAWFKSLRRRGIDIGRAKGRTSIDRPDATPPSFPFGGARGGAFTPEEADALRAKIAAEGMTPENKAAFDAMSAEVFANTTPEYAAPPPPVRPGGVGERIGQAITGEATTAPRSLDEAKEQVLKAVQQEANIRRVGTAAREISETRRAQAQGIRNAAELARAEGLTAEEIAARARGGAYRGGEGSARQTYAKPLEIAEETKQALFADITDQMLSGQMREFDYLRSMKALNKVIDGRGLQLSEIKLVRNILGDEVANIVGRRAKDLESEVLSGAQIATERARLDTLGRRAAQDALKSETRQSVREVESRLRALGADTDLPIPPRPDDEIIRLANMSPDRVAGDLKQRVIRAQKIVGAYEDGIANAAKRDRVALEKSSKIIEDGIDFEARQSAKQANDAAAKYAALTKRQEVIHSRRLADEAGLIDEAIGAEAQGIRKAVAGQASETVQQMTGAARAARNKARDEMIDAFNRADDATIQSLRADAETLAAQETARSARFRTPGVLEGAQTTVRQADELLTRLTQKFPDEATLMTRAGEIADRALVAAPRAERAQTRAAVQEMIRVWDKGNRAILDTMGEEAPAFVRAISSQITGNVADSWLTTAMQRRAILSNALRSELDPKVASRVSEALFNKEMLSHYKVSDPSKLPAEVLEFIRQTKSLPYEAGTGAVETLVQRAKNTQFGLADMGVFGVNVLNNVRRGGIQALAGYINKGLTALHLPHIDTHLDNPILDRKIMASLDGVHQGTTYGATVPDKGSLLQYGGKYAQAVDRQIDKLVNASTDFQFGTILGSLRNADYEGNLVMLKLLGRDIDNPLVRSQAAANANHLSGFANGALKRGRATVEGIALTSSSMTRARVAQIADMAKLITPKASVEERALAAMGIASTVGYTLAVGKLLNDRIGVTDFVFDPSMPGFGTITTADGRTHDTIPQDSVERAFAKSLRALSEMDENTAANVAKAWGNVLIGSASLVGRVPAAGFGVGYQPGRGYRYGDWGNGMTGGQKAASLLPIPPIGTDLATQGLSPVGTAESFIGIGNYPASGKALAEAGLYGQVGTPQQQFEGIKPQAWRLIQQNAPEQLKEQVGTGSFYDWFKAQEQQMNALVAERAPQLTEAERSRYALELVRKNPVYKAYLNARSRLTDQWVMDNPDLAKEMDDDMQDVPPSERQFVPTKRQRAVIGQ